MSATLMPLEEAGRQSARKTHPVDWQNPTPPGRYNLLVVGGSDAACAAAITAAGWQSRVALVRPQRSKNDSSDQCGVSSKALLHSIRAVCQSGRFAAEQADALEVAFPRFIDALRRAQAEIDRRNSFWRLTGAGVDVYSGGAQFVAARTVEVDGTQIHFDRAILALDSRPKKVELPGLKDAGYLTSDSVLSLVNLPRTLVVIGGGPTACELAQAFRCLGSEVHLVVKEDGILPAEDRQAAALVRAQLERDKVRVHIGATLIAAGKTGRSKSIVIERRGSKQELIADEILVALGREPDVDNLGLEAAGVHVSTRGLEVDDRLRTSNPSIFAAWDSGPSCDDAMSAEATARVCLQNALFSRRKKFSRLTVPRCIRTSPELAHVGLTPREADEAGIELDNYRVELGSGGPNVAEGKVGIDAPGLVVLHTRRGRARVVGATVVAPQAGEMIGQVSLLMARRLPIYAFCDMLACYPSGCEALRLAAGIYRQRRLTLRIRLLLDRWFSWRRQPLP